MNERDNKRGKVYASENAALIPRQSKLATVKDIDRYLRRQCKRKTLIKRYGRALDLDRWVLDIADGRGTVNGLAYGTYKINIPLWARNDRVVLHEFAHIVHARITAKGHWTGGDRAQELAGGAAHGWQFCSVYLDLVKFCMGKEAAEALKAEFKARKVRFTAPRPKRKLTEEQRAVLAERMANMRVRKAA